MDDPNMDMETLTGTKSQERIDAEHLNTLTLCHYIGGAIIALFSCMFIMHIVMGVMMIHNPSFFSGPSHPYPQGPPYPAGQPYPPVQPYPMQPYPFFPPGMGYMFATMGTVAVLGGWTLGGLTVYAGKCLKARKNYIFILIMAGVNCAFVMPLGTALGVFTFIVLLRPSVKTLFNANAVKW